MLNRRTFLGTTAVAAAGVTLAGCGGGDDAVDVTDADAGAMDSFGVNEQFKTPEPFELTTLYSDQPTYPYKADWLFFTELTKRTGVTLKPTIVPSSDYEQKRSLLVSAGEAPLLIPKTYPGQEDSFVSSGAVLAISDYVENMPNFQDKVSKWKLEDELETLKQADGKYYVLPGLHEELWPDYTLCYRADVFEELGLSEPETWDDLLDTMRTLREKKPDSWPLSDRFTGNSLLQIMATTYGASCGWSLSNGDGVVRKEEGSDELAFGPILDGYKAFLENLATGVSEKLIDPESFSQLDDDAVEKFVTGASQMISCNAQQVIDYRATMDNNLGKDQYKIKKMVVPGGPLGQIVGGSRLENGIMFNADLADDDHFLAILQFVDWLWYSDDGQEFAKWGVEGTTFTKEGEEWKPAPDVNFLGLNPDGTKDLRKEFGFSGGNFAYGGSTALLQSTMDDEEKEWQQKMADSKTAEEPLPPYPFDEDQLEQATLISTPLTDTAQQETLKFITGKRDLGEWDTYVKQTEDNGADSYLELVKEAQDAFANKS